MINKAKQFTEEVDNIGLRHDLQIANEGKI